ncbi:unnamed protein product [Gordionus sp. m RMFG-2023]
MESEYSNSLFCHQLFVKGDYEECLKNLMLLSQKYPNDAKIIHNIAVTEFYASQTSKIDQLRENLKRACFLANANIDDINTFTQPNQAIFFLNNAILMFYLKQFHHALAIVERLFNTIFYLDSKLGLQICLLLIELYISTFYPENALKIIYFTDILMFGVNHENDNTQNDETKRDTYYECFKPNSWKDNEFNIKIILFENGISLNHKFDDAYHGIVSSKYKSMYKSTLAQYRIKCHIMLKNMRQCKKEVKNLANLYANGVTSIPRGPNLPNAAYFKSENEYMKGNYRKSLKILNLSNNSSFNSNPAESNQEIFNGFNVEIILVNKFLSSCYYNDLASNHLSLNKPHLSVFYCRKALQENEDLIGEFPEFDNNMNLTNTSGLGNQSNIYGPKMHNADHQSPSHTTNSYRSLNTGKSLPLFIYDKRHELLHNLGIHLLHAKKPLPAFDCLIEIIQVYHCNPRIWLRLSECCIVASKGGNEENFSLKRKLQSAVQHIMGFGIHRKTILIPSHPLKSDSHQSSAMPMATLEFASLCLKNAQLLIEQMSENYDVNQLGERLFNMAPSNPINEDEVHVLKCSILAASAYVQLSLGDYYSALEHSNSLIKILQAKGGSVVLSYLAMLYASESLILKDNLRLALPHLEFEAMQIKTNKDNQPLNNAVDDTKPQQERLVKWSLLPILFKNLKNCRSRTNSANGDKMNLSADDSGDGHMSSIKGLDTLLPLISPFNWTPHDTTSAKLVMHYNLCVCYALLGEFEKASHMLRNNIPFKSPNDLPSQFIALALYLAIKQGHLDIARMIILQNFSQIQY